MYNVYSRNLAISFLEILITKQDVASLSYPVLISLQVYLSKSCFIQDRSSSWKEVFSLQAQVRETEDIIIDQTTTIAFFKMLYFL